MVHVLALALLLFSTAAHAITAPTGVPAKSFGGINLTLPNIAVATTDTTYFTLTAATLAANNNTFWNFYKDGGSPPVAAAVYRVPQGKTTECDSFVYTGGVASAGFQLVSSMTAFARADTSLTAGYYQGGAAHSQALTVVTANVPIPQAFIYNFASNSYPGIEITNASNGLAHNVNAHCREY